MQQPTAGSLTPAQLGAYTKQLLKDQPPTPELSQLLQLPDDQLGTFVAERNPKLKALFGAPPAPPAPPAPTPLAAGDIQRIAAGGNPNQGHASGLLMTDAAQMQRAAAAPRLTVDQLKEMAGSGLVPESAGGVPARPLPTSAAATHSLINALPLPGPLKTAGHLASEVSGIHLPASAALAAEGFLKEGLNPSGAATSGSDPARAASTLLVNAKQGLTLGLDPQSRAQLLDPRTNDPRMQGLALTGQLGGQLATTLATGGGLSTLSRVAGLPARLGARGAQTAVGAATGGLVQGVGEIGREQLAAEAGLKEPGVNPLQVAAQGLAGAITGGLPAGVGLGARNPLVRTAAGMVSGGAIGAGSTYVQQALARDPGSPPITLEDPQVQQATRLAAVIGAVTGGLATAHPTPLTGKVTAKGGSNPQLIEPRAPYAGAAGESLAQTIQRTAGSAPMPRAAFRAAWKRTGLPEELLDIADVGDLVRRTSSKTASPTVDPAQVSARIEAALAELPQHRGTATVLGDGRVAWTPDDAALYQAPPVAAAPAAPAPAAAASSNAPVTAVKAPPSVPGQRPIPAGLNRRKLALYKMAAMADGADELVIGGRTIALDSSVRWKLQHHASALGMPGPLPAETLVGHAQVKAAAEQASALTYAIPTKRLPVGAFWQVLDSISTPMFRKWVGLNSLLANRRVVDPDLVQHLVAPYWAGSDVVTTTPNASMRDVGFLPTVWWKGKIEQLSTTGSRADQIEAAHLTNLQQQLATRFTPWHVRVFRGDALGDPTSMVISEPSKMPTWLPATPIGAYRNEAISRLNAIKASFDATPTPQLEARLKAELTALYGGRTPAAIKVDESAFRFHTSMRAIMAATEAGASRALLPITDASQDAVERVAAEFGLDFAKSVAAVGDHGGVPRKFLVVPITAEMRTSIQAGFTLPRANISTAVRAIAAATLMGDEDESDTADGAKMLAASLLLPRLSPRLLKWIKTNPLPARMITGGLVGGAAGKLVAKDEHEGVGTAAGAALGLLNAAGLHGLISRGASVALWDDIEKLHAALPNVSATLQPNSIREERWNAFRRLPNQSLGSWLRMVAQKNTEAWRELHGDPTKAIRPSGFTNYASIKRLGEVGRPAVEYLNRYQRQLEDRAQIVQRTVLPALAPLTNAGELRLFDEFLMIRQRMEDYFSHQDIGKVEQPDPMIQASREAAGQAPLNAVLPTDVIDMHRELAYLVNQHPNVRAAVDRFDQMMGALGEEMVSRGMLTAEELAKSGPHYPAYKIYELNPALIAEIPGAGPYSIAARNNPDFLRGGLGPTLHSYTEVLPKFVGELHTRFTKDDLVRDLAAAYDPSRIVAQYGQGAVQQLDYVPHNWVRMEGADPVQVALPRVIKEQLDWQFDGIDRAVAAYPQVLRMWNKATAGVKSWIINGSLGTFYLNNFLGDMFTNHSFTPMAEWPKLWGHYVDAALSEFNPAALDEATRARLAAGEAEGLGIGAASAEMSDNLRRDPHVIVVTTNPRASGGQRYVSGLREGWQTGKRGLDKFRTAQEGIGRKAGFLQLMDSKELSALPEAARVKRAALMTDQRIASYSDTSPAFRALIKNGLLPLFTWYAKQAAERIPYISRDVATLSRDVQGQRAVAALTKALIGGVGASLINNFFTPDVEAAHDDWLKATPHINVPIDARTTVVLSFPFPGTAVANLAGLGGFTNRVVDMMAGRSDLWEQIEQSAATAKRTWTGMVTPMITVPLGAASGADVRTGAPITDPRKPLLGWRGKAADYAKFILGSLPPFSTLSRTAVEAGDLNEGIDEFLLRATVGSVYRVVDNEKAKNVAAHRDFMKAIAEGLEKAKADRYAATHTAGQKFAIAVGAKGAPRVAPTKELLQDIGPLQTKLMYALLRENPSLGKPLGLGDRQSVDSFLADLSDLTKELAHEAGGRADLPDGSSWDATWRLLQTAQQHPAVVTYDEIIEARKKRSSTLFKR